MKQILLTIFFSIAIIIAHTQPTISPSLNNEYCPNVEYTFTATITKAYSSMIGVGGCYVTQLPASPVGTTFTFKGKFADVNQKQTFRIYHPDNTWTDFDFKRIKSLFYGTCTPIQPNQTTVTAARCQIVNIPISFNNVQWKTEFENPQLCFGSITTYEYQLPNGWSIGANVSNGSNWIAGGNNVTVTSDLSNGVNGTIKVRPVNSCGTGLQPGAFSTISISRPAPTLSVTGNQTTICSGCETFTIYGMPSGATVQWSLSNTDASISGCSTCTTVTVCRNSSANTVVDLIATVSHCTFSYVAGIPIVLGSPQPGAIQVNLIDLQLGRIEVEVDDALSGGPYNWYRDGGLVNNYHANWAKIPIPRGVCDVDYGISVETVNACGTSAQSFIVVYVPCEEYYRMSPNPASSEVTVTADQTKSVKGTNSTFDELKIYNQQGNLKKYQKFAKVKQTRVNVSDLSNGIYVVEIINGTYKERKQLIIQK